MLRSVEDEGDDAGATDQNLRLRCEQVLLSQLEVDDKVLFFKGSDSHVIRRHAKQYLTESTISHSQIWKKALQNYLQEHPAVQSLAHKLKLHGCSRQVATIQSWICDDVIGPEDAQTVLPVLAQITQDSALQKHHQECLQGVMEVRKAHVRAGKELAKQVMARIQQHLEAHDEWDLAEIELDGELTMITVEAVDVKLIEVPASLVNRAQDLTKLNYFITGPLQNHAS